jgi:transglutaminase-like putative cysteine protease
LADRLTRNQPTQYDKVMALVRYIEQNTAYNLNVEAYPTDVDVAEYFLFEAKQGYCVEFATALAVLCLYADIPARVASGFILRERDPETGEFIVREKHRHLWTEVYFEGDWLGGVRCDSQRACD